MGYNKIVLSGAGTVGLSENISFENIDEIEFRNTNGAQQNLTLVLGNDEIDGTP